MTISNGSGRSMIRIHDERNFEFEISVDNLIGILMHSDVSKRDIIQECIFAWSGRSLVLLPTNSDDYQEALVYTKKQAEDVKQEDLIPGKTYSLKENKKTITFLGKMDWYDWKSSNGNKEKEHYKKTNDNIFYDEKDFFIMKVDKLSSEASDDIDNNLSKKIEDFFKTIHAQKIINIKIREIKTSENASEIFKIKDNKLILFRYYDYKENKERCDLEKHSITLEYEISLKKRLKQIHINKKYSIPLDIQEKVKEKGLSLNDIDTTEYRKIIHQLGYGSVVYELENNNEVDS